MQYMKTVESNSPTSMVCHVLKRKVVWAGCLFASIMVFVFTACGAENDTIVPPEEGNENPPIEIPEDMTTEQREIAAFIEQRNAAMVNRDTAALGRMMADDIILVHINGRRQTKQEWLTEIANETMRYYNIRTENLSIEINGNHASASFTSIIEARIWGSHNTWTLNGGMYLTRTEDGWIWSNREEEQ